jgi:signal transduction histidine kinase
MHTLNPQELSNYLGIAHREAVRLGSLVEDLLSLARTEADQLRLNMASVQPAEVIEEVYQSLLPLARKDRMITLVRSLPPNLPPVQADRQRLIQVLANLVRNAITYTPDGGIISLTTHQEHEYLVISVADTGIGIPAEQLEQIFERFYRTDASRSRSSGGFGLGLSIVQDLVEAMQGRITVESKEGEGSCFHVHLRIAQVTTSYNASQQPMNKAM